MYKKYPKVSIIIPLYIKTPYFFESVEKCLELDYPNFEVLIGVDSQMNVLFKDKRVRIIKTRKKRTGPAEKRDIGIIKAKGDIIAFLDDDSYPEKDWLKKAVYHLKKQKVASVCGPGLTPPADTFFQKMTGAIIGSKFGSGPYYYRFVKGSPRYVDDYPAYNLIVTKKVLKEVGGYGTKFYGGEDTALCIKLINAGEKIYYHPDIVVYHHRRSFPFEYSKQVGNVGKHRGYFVKAYPSTSLRISYFGPALFCIGLPVLLVLLLFIPELFNLYILLFTLYYVVVVAEAYKREEFFILFFLPFAILVNYWSYGINFLKGLFFTKKMIR